MTESFKPEVRYIVFKISDIDSYLSKQDRRDIEMHAAKIAVNRVVDNRGALNGIFIERDWPEYEPTWNALAGRITGDTEKAVAYRWKERDHWFDWTTDWQYHDRAKVMGFEIEYAYAKG